MSLALADNPTKTTTSTTSVVTPCVATSTNGAFFDLRPDQAIVVAEGEKPPKGVPTEDYTARGWDYGTNFTLNICGAVVGEVTDVVGVEEKYWRNVSAYYTKDGKIYSLGLQSGDLIPRGRKLVLQYTGGSPCGAPENKRRRKRQYLEDDPEERHSRYDDEWRRYDEGNENWSDEDRDRNNEGSRENHEEDREDKPPTTRRKSALISFLCDRDPDTPTAASFVGTDPDECAYFFEVRSKHACAAAEPHKPGSVGPGGVFAIIFFITVLVYVIGGVFYQRTVAHARGWRQLPNYSLWAGIWSFVKVRRGDEQRKSPVYSAL